MDTDAMTSQYSIREEIAHSITHGIGVLLSISGLAVLVAFSALNGDSWHIVSTSIYGATLIFLYTSSTLYHGIPNPNAKKILQQLDHAAIYLLIAGTYTPFTLVSLRGELGWTLFGIVWALALIGVALEFTAKQKLKRVSVGIYLALGWLIIVAIKPMITSIGQGGLTLLVAGGLCYSLGVIFYVRKSMTYHHAIWHLFVLAGSACHFFAIFFYVIPDSQ